MTYNTSIVKKGVDAKFHKAYKLMQEQPYLLALASLFMKAPSTGASEEYVWLGDVPGVREWIGNKVFKGLKDYDYTIKNKDWYNGFSIDRNELADEKIQGIMPRVEMLAQSLAKFPAELIIDLITGGDSGLAYDGLPFFSNASGVRTNDNLLAGSGVTSDNIKANITSARTAMMKFTSDSGRVMGLLMDTIVCPPELEATFLELTTSVVGEATARPAANWIKNVIVCPELTDTGDWYGFAAGSAIKPFIYQERTGVKTEIDDSEVKKNRKINYSAEARGNAGYGFPQMAIKVVNS
ncbi:MAG: Mu-like prophage major head subunit gpT family protein [Spirochaetales bacterium]|nr:Mu-like prophage major head subunit gpT family protein [Spirochaetales bacterium]